MRIALGLLLYTVGLVAVAAMLDADIARKVRALPGRIAKLADRALSSGDVGGSGQRLSIRIATEDLATIRRERDEAVSQVAQISDRNTWVPARVSRGGAAVKARLRLKGALGDHWDDPTKWSFAIKVRGGELLDRMDRFSIQHPKTRGYIAEWLLLRALADEGLMALRFEFVDVWINEEPRGIYALQEQPGKLVVERHGMREGPIIAFDKSAWIEYWLAHSGAAALGFRDPESFLASAPITATEPGSIEKGSDLERAHGEAVALLDAFRSGRMPASEVFEIDEMARLAAVHAVLGAAELDWKDLKFYYNPLTSRLHPIGKEIHYSPTIEFHRWWVNDSEPPFGSPFPEQLFRDPEFERRYVAELDRVSRPEWGAQFFARHHDELSEQLRILANEFPEYEFSRSELSSIGALIQHTLHPSRVALVHFGSANGDRVELDVANLHAFRLEVVGARHPRLGMLRAEGSPILSGHSVRDAPSYRVVTLRLPPGTSWSKKLLPDLALVCRVPGLSDEFEVPVSRWSSSARIDLRSDDYRRLRPSTEHEFLRVDEQAREILCLPGQWVIREPVVIPEGYRLVAGAGVDWDLRDGAFVLSRSPVQFVGSEEQPVVIRSSDFSGAGLAVIGAGDSSELRHFVARGLSSPVRGRWALTGAVTFYESPVRISDAFFADNRRGDDLVNLVRSEFSVARSTFRDVAADAIDADFSDGSVVDTRFHDVGNDALDTSGAKVTVTGVFIDGAGDKGMSFGEQSHADVSRVTIRRAHVGLASKDGSEVTIASSEVSGAEFGLAAYRKKPEFDPGRIVATDVRLLETKAPTLAERGAAIELDGQACPADHRDVHATVTK